MTEKAEVIQEQSIEPVNIDEIKQKIQELQREQEIDRAKLELLDLLEKKLKKEL